MHDDFYISSFKRLIAYIIDAVIVGLVLSLIFGDANPTTIVIIKCLLFFAYFILMSHYLGFTLGQKLFKLKTINAQTGGLPNLKELLLRELVALTAWIPIGLLIANFTHSYQSGFYWDRWSNTKVIPAKLKLAEFNRQLEKDRQTLFPDKV